LVRERGSIGVVLTMLTAQKVPILYMNLSLPEHGYHVLDEYFDWGQAFRRDENHCALLR